MTDAHKELESICKKNGGILRPVDVVKFARNPKTSLHGSFQWDDTKAANEYRIWQARQVIRIVFYTIESSAEPIRTYVSLGDDRKDGGGYRAMVDVLSSEDMMAKLLDEALAELNVFRAKYSSLEALRPMFAAVDAVKMKRVRS